MVVSGDRDVYQVVEDGVRVMTTSRGITDTRVYDAEGVMERYGVPPELVTDLIGLKGDTSDNIPGVPGIGDKTAAQLLQEFGSLEEVLANVDKISGAKRKQNLTEHADDARISKQLATLVCDIDTGVDLEELMATRHRPQPPARVHARVRAAGDHGAPRGGARRRRLPGRLVEEALDGPAAVEGTIGDLAEGEVALAIFDSTWAAADGEQDGHGRRGEWRRWPRSSGGGR